MARGGKYNGECECSGGLGEYSGGGGWSGVAAAEMDAETQAAVEREAAEVIAARKAVDRAAVEKVAAERAAAVKAVAESTAARAVAQAERATAAWQVAEREAEQRLLAAERAAVDRAAAEKAAIDRTAAHMAAAAAREMSVAATPPALGHLATSPAAVPHLVTDSSPSWNPSISPLSVMLAFAPTLARALPPTPTPGPSSAALKGDARFAVAAVEAAARPCPKLGARPPEGDELASPQAAPVGGYAGDAALAAALQAEEDAKRRRAAAEIDADAEMAARLQGAEYPRSSAGYVGSRTIRSP